MSYDVAVRKRPSQSTLSLKFGDIDVTCGYRVSSGPGSGREEVIRQTIDVGKRMLPRPEARGRTADDEGVKHTGTHHQRGVGRDRVTTF